MVLILTEPGDGHAYAVAEALRLKGGRPLVWHTSDFPSLATETVLLDGASTRVRIAGIDLKFEIDNNSSDLTIWHRRPAFSVDLASLHPADVQFAESECTVFRRSLLSALAPQAFWVNRPDAAIVASRKLVQHQAAVAAGFKTPATLYSNNPTEIKNFLQSYGGVIVYKPFRGAPWRSRETFWVPYTSTLDRGQLVPDQVLRNVPGIYQQLIPKAFELRVTIMGKRIFAAKILSQETRDGRVDWRKAYSELKMEPFALPGTIAQLCRNLLGTLGLVFGCFDLIVTPAGEYVFLEVNEMGQFLFVENYTGMPLLDAFSEFLLQGTTDFLWDETKATVRYPEIRATVEREVALSKKEHVQPAAQGYCDD